MLTNFDLNSKPISYLQNRVTYGKWFLNKNTLVVICEANMKRGKLQVRKVRKLLQ